MLRYILNQNDRGLHSTLVFGARFFLPCHSTSFNRKVIYMDRETDFLADVVMADRAPVVLSRYGFRKETFEGQTYLVTLTRMEFVAVLAKHKGVTLEAAEHQLDAMDKGRAYCTMMSSWQCRSVGGCPNCVKTWESGSYFCNCVD